MKPKSGSKAKTIVTIFMVLLGLAFTAVGGGFTIASYGFSQNAVAATGTVVDMEVSRSSSSNSGSGSLVYQPTIAFTDQAGNKHSGQTFLSSSGYNYPLGAQVDILYDARTPSSLRIDSWFALWGFGLVFLLAGLLTLAGVVLVRALWAKRARAAVGDDSPPVRQPEKTYSYSSNRQASEGGRVARPKQAKHNATVRRNR